MYTSFEPLDRPDQSEFDKSLVIISRCQAINPPEGTTIFWVMRYKSMFGSNNHDARTHAWPYTVPNRTASEDYDCCSEHYAVGIVYASWPVWMRHYLKFWVKPILLSHVVPICLLIAFLFLFMVQVRLIWLNVTTTDWIAKTEELYDNLTTDWQHISGTSLLLIAALIGIPWHLLTYHTTHLP